MVKEKVFNMLCSRCQEKAVFSQPRLCKDHLITHVNELVKNTIKDYKLLKKSDKVCVAASGGKDSVTVLAILHKLGYQVSALAIDEGIANYREHTLTFLKSFCKKRDIPLNIVSFKDVVGKPLDDLVKDQHPCSVCGVFRRYALNKYSKDFDVIATGHNLDDEAQVVLMNLIKANKDLHRTFLRTPLVDGFTPKIKPLMFVPEKMIRAYTILRNFDLGFDECPYVSQALRAQVRDELNAYENNAPGMKRKLVEAALHVAKAPTSKRDKCPLCGEPSAKGICRTCSLKKELGL